MQDFVRGFQERRAKVTDEVVKDFMAAKPLTWGGNPNVKRVVPIRDAGNGAEGAGDGTLSKSQMKKLEKEKMVAAKKAAKEAAKAETATAP